MVSAAVVLREDNAIERPAALLSRAEVLTRYRHLREISRQHHSAVLDFLSKDTIISQARRLGLAQGKTLLLDSMDDLNFVFDLAIHTAKDRSRAIDRYARAVRLAPGSDETLMLEAMRRARFAIISIVRRHPVAGLIVKDLFRGVEVWLVDEGLESSLPDGAALATRLFTPEGFAMTAGVLVPLDIELIEDAIADTPQLLRNRREELIDDRRFAEAIYRVALASGLMEQVAYQDTIAEAG
ncbi:hypothetical protein Nham_4307 (plasmid) [Nitrobacter hamburgensis X14]|uniref:Uncharacterized protein n=1 Tax=Nitrobacter hamburgensis (strain DSM 10229 / NCIMB 13809 / X14) TaxID=323097 RepID=Q1QFU1_NITHX|nr:hypothetical protein [Nitrobacter hamburgensis]ABE64906.1 hypothetical protein Nham_4307 [Nitrobacter hamburgensis X14]